LPFVFDIDVNGLALAIRRMHDPVTTGAVHKRLQLG
jgi:hypothetical protein